MAGKKKMLIIRIKRVLVAIVRASLRKSIILRKWPPEAQKLLDSWKSGESSNTKCSKKDWKKIRKLMTSDNPLGKKLQEKLLISDKLRNYLSSFTLTLTQPERSEKLDNFLHTLELEEVDILGDHFCLFNAIMRWLQVHPEIAPDVDRAMTGRELFTMLAPKGVQLGQIFPQHLEMQAIARAFTETGANYRAWGTASMVQHLIAPWLDIPVLVLSESDVYQAGAVNGVLYELGDALPLFQGEIENIMTSNTMVLIHRQNHWQVAIPSAALIAYNTERQTDNSQCPASSCQSFQQQ